MWNGPRRTLGTLYQVFNNLVIGYIWAARKFISDDLGRSQMRLSRKLRKRFFYMIPEAGAQAFYSRAGSYRAADDGIIPTEWHGRFRLVPKKRWDRIRKQIL